ncbi:MAG TPA: TonB-dependent receptor, partial [Rubrivivax sp.]|nr:TonB-dependent receptor [Rubrivivax sp.]
RIASLALRGDVRPGWGIVVTASDATDGYDTLSSASTFAALGEIRTRQRHYGWHNHITTPAGTLLLLGERTEEKVSRPGQPFAVSERHVDAVGAGLSGSGGVHTWQASLRRDRNSQFGAQDNGALAYGLVLSPAWRVGASIGQSYVAPSFNQLYFPNFGNPNLVPEEGQHGELSVRWTAGAHALRAGYYEHRYRGFITSGQAPVNLPKVHIDGVTLAYEARLGDVDIDASIDHVDPRNATPASANNGRLLPRRAQRALRFGADWQAGAFGAGATLAAFSHRFDDTANTLRLGGYGTLDLRAEWRLRPGLTLQAKLNNVANKRYETVYGYDQPGREGFLSLRWALR